ncbi:hypothetical protein LTS17_011249 [Exophiala oligosperma]
MRKIKCDTQKPRCSHCITYARDCTYAAPSRKSRPKRRKVVKPNEENPTDLHARVRHLESQIQQFSERSKSDERNPDAQRELQEPTPTPSPVVTMPMPMMTNQEGSTDCTRSSRALDLPPLQQILPVVHLFLENFNTVLPLFHAESLLRLLHTTYNLDARSRDPVSWAAINIVVALAHRHWLTDRGNINRAMEYLVRAQSVLSEIVLDETKLLNIQVLVGMVMLLQGAKDLKPALILISTTMRLAHKIGLHNRTSAAHLDATVAGQCARVFWLAYILDKNISLRAKQPSIQRDDDIDLDLPCPVQTQKDQFNSDQADGDDGLGTGMISTIDGAFKMDYFVTRIHLAVIEGGVYDYLYSTASQKRSLEERSHALNSVSKALEQWKTSIPLQFRGVDALQRLSPSALRFLGTLDATSLMCTTMINQAHAWNAEWITSLQKYDKEGTVPLLPPRWSSLVDESRRLLVLFEQLGSMDRWNFCMHDPQHDMASLDSQLVDIALGMLASIVDETNYTNLRSFHNTCAELHRNTQQKRQYIMMAANDRNSEPNFLDPAWHYNGLGFEI